MKRATGKRIGVSALAIFWTAVAATGLLAQSGTQELKMTVGKSVVIDYPSDVGRISTSNPDIVDAVPITAREILVNAKANGQSTLVVWSKSGERSFFAVTVDQNLEGMQKLLKDAFPNENIEIVSSRDSAALNGRVSSQAVSDRAVALMVPLVKSVVNNLQVAAGPGRKADRSACEVRGIGPQPRRTVWHQHSVDRRGQYARKHRNRAVRSGGPTKVGGGEGTSFSITDALNIFAFRPDLNLAVVIKALQTPEHPSDSGRAESGDDQWQRGELPRRRRVSGAGSAGRRQRRSGHDSVPRVRNPAELPSHHDRERHDQDACEAGVVHDRSD